VAAQDSQTSNQTAAPTNTNPSAKKGNITTGQKVEAVTQSIDTTGGIIAVSKPGDPLDGFVLNVPANYYTAASNFKVSYAPITNQTFGSDINPITPLITIDNGGIISNNQLYIRIPAKIRADQFAMAFIYDAKTKQLEGVPMVAADEDSVTITTTHFCDLFLSMISKALLKKDIDSGLKPGVDDWQFSNRGSYIAPGGHCEGQSLAAMWYYCIQPDGNNAHLYGRYDNNGIKPATPALWEDDSLGYRFCSVAQKVMNKGANKFWMNISGEKYSKVNGEWKVVDIPLGLSSEMTWECFAYSMQATNEPQLVGLDDTKSGSGHCVICYRVNEGNLYIADPNYPGNLGLSVTYANGILQPYKSGSNADEIAKGNGSTYDRIEYYGKTTVVPWDKMAALWDQLKNKTIGDGIFPAYDLVYNYNDPLIDKTTTPWEAINIHTINPAMDCDIYRDGTKLTPDSKGNYTLEAGNNNLGIIIWGKVNAEWEYIDFKYVNVIYNADLAITPHQLDGEIGKEYTFSVVHNAPHPKDVTYDWYVNKELKQSSSITDFKTTFAKGGSYIVDLSVNEAGLVLGKDSANATIKDVVNLTTPANNLAIIQKYGYMEALIMTNSLIHEYNLNNKPPDADKQTNVAFWTLYTPITWDGVNFSGTRTDTPMGVTQTETLSGTVSPDGNTLLTLTSKLQSDSAIEHKTVTIVLQNVPLSYVNGIMVNDVDLSSATVQKYVVSLDNSFTDVANGAIYFSNTFKSPVWDNNSNLSISFRKTATR